MTKRTRQRDYVCIVVGVLIGIYAVARLAWHSLHPNYLGFFTFLVIGVILAISGLMRRRTTRDWIKEEYAKDAAVDPKVRRSRDRARLANALGLLLLVAAVGSTYFEFRYADANYVFIIQMCLGVAGLALIAYSAVAHGMGEYRAIRRARDSQSRDKS
jgi:peptidoglycan/LPS O-acetylase OafA/YrhL